MNLNQKNSNYFGVSNKVIGSNTSDVILSLMKDVNLNQRLKNELITCASKGKPFPFVPKNIIQPKRAARTYTKPSPLKLPPKPIQRSKQQIEQSGLYEAERYRPNPSKTRSAQEKERFQDIMAFGRDIAKERKHTSKDVTEHIHEDSLDLFDEILLEIKERKEFIEEMRELGLAKKYLPEIQCQIAVRLKELEKLDKMKAQKLVLDHE